jgi:HSP20 family protein
MAEEETKQIARWDPFRDLASWEPWAGFREGSRLARLMDEMFGERPRLGVTVPAVDVTECDDHYLVTAEVPGVKREDLTLEIREGVLSLRGEKRSEREETKEKARLLERSYGAFSRSFSLPADADAEKISAKFEDGVLKVTIKKRPEAKPKAISIKS